MDTNQAFEILNLSINSSKEEIKDSHKELIKESYPREADVNHDKAALLNSARDTAIKYIDDMENNVSLMRQVVEIMRVDNSLIAKAQNYRNQSNAIFNNVSRKYGSKHKRIKSKVKLVGAVSATLALASSNILPIFENITKENPQISIAFGIITFIIAIYYNSINSMAEKIQDSIDELKEILDDKANYYEIFNSIIIYKENNSKKISKKEFELLISYWLSDKPIDDNNLSESTLNRTFTTMFSEMEFSNYTLKDLAKKIGLNDFVKLVISKGLEKNILLEEEIVSQGNTYITYLINTKSST